MKNFYPHGHIMPGGDGSSECSPRQQVAVPRTAAIDLSTASRTYSLVKFNSYRKRGKAGSPPAPTSNPYDVLKRVDWLVLFSPWAIVNRAKVYRVPVKQTSCGNRTSTKNATLKGLAIAKGDPNTCTTRTPTNNAALKGLAIAKGDPNTCATRTLANNAALKGLAIAKGSTTVVPKIFMVRRAHHDIKPNTCATRTPANNAALKGLAIAKGGTTVVPKIFSGEFWTLLRSNCKAIIHAIEKPTIMDNVSCLACPDYSGSGIEDGKPVRRERRGNELNGFHTPFPSILHLLLPTIFVSVFICFSGAAKAQSRQDVGTAEVVNAQESASDQDEFTRYDYSLTKAVSRRAMRGSAHERERRRYPKADFKKFPLEVYTLDTSDLPIIVEGELIPDQILDLPLWVVNDSYGRDTITLRESIDMEWLILDFWTEWCPPCIPSMMKWESISNKYENMVLYGVYSSNMPHRAAIETRKKRWQSVQVIGPSSAILSHVFLGPRGALGPSVWIKNGRLYGVSNAGSLEDSDYDSILRGEMDRLPSHAIYKRSVIKNND